MGIEYKIAICDDEKNHINIIRSLLPDMEIDIFTFPEILLTELRKGKVYDVLFLDIIMPNIDGISLAREIRELYEDVVIVFITSKFDFVQMGYEVKAFRYLLKDQLTESFTKVWKEIINELEARQDRYFSFEFDKQLYRFSYRDIIYIESRLRRIVLHTKNEKYVFYGKLDEIELAHPFFVRIHKSFLINSSFLRNASSDTVVLMNGEILPVSRKYFANLRKMSL